MARTRGLDRTGVEIRGITRERELISLRWKYPLQWPGGWRRSQARKTPRFTVDSETVLADLEREITHGNDGKSIAISSNVPVDRYGEPRLDARCVDPAVVVTFESRGRRHAIACETYPDVLSNLRAISSQLQALRSIKRHGASVMMEASLMSEYVAIAPPPNWRKVLELHDTQCITRDAIDDAWRRLAKRAHPDSGGSHEQMAELNAARDSAIQELENIDQGSAVLIRKER